MFIKKFLIPFLLISLILAACSSAPQSSGKLKVVATTNILGDVVANIGGEAIELTILLPLGADPHSFEPAPQDLAAVEDANLVFTNGLGLEEFLGEMVENAAQTSVVAVSEGLPDLMEFEGHDEEEEGEDHHEEAYDPHVWMDPQNVMHWTAAIAVALSEADPANGALYQANAQAYAAELGELHAWALTEMAAIPPEQRMMVTDHHAFGYFGRAYDVEIVGALLPGFSTLAEPSAQELAALEDAIRAAGVEVIFVSITVNPNLAERVAQDTGVQLVRMYTGSLSEAGGEAPTYIEMMRYDVNAAIAAWMGMGE